MTTMYPSKDAIEEVIGAFIHAMISSRQSLGDFIAKFELWEQLTDNEKELLTKSAVLFQEFLDKEKNNGKLG